MHKDIGIIIPALEKNRYSEDGDLVRFWDLNLFEWKLTQVKNFTEPENVFISTPSRKIEKITKSYGMNVLKRREDLPMSKVVSDCAKKIGRNILIWTHVTSPFISGDDFRRMFDKFLKLEVKYDSLAAVFKLQEFIIFKNKALNFEMTKVTTRKTIEPVYKITNGCFIARKDIYLRYKNYFGERPFLYEIDALSSMEIKEVEDLAIANDLISLFFKKELHV